MDSDEAFKEVFDILEDSKLKYMLSGGVAATYWIRPRTTYDIDLVIEIDTSEAQEKLQKVIKALIAQGWEEIPDQYRVAVLKKAGARIDFWQAKDKYDKTRLDRRQKIKLYGKNVWITTKEDLFIKKLDWYRDKDKDDIAMFLQLVKGVDWRYVKKWVKELGLKDRLDAIVRSSRRETHA